MECQKLARFCDNTPRIPWPTQLKVYTVCWQLSCNMSQAFIHSFTRVPKLIHHVFTYIHGMVPSPLPPPIHGQRESVTYNWISHPFNIHFLEPYMFVVDSYQMTWTIINVGYSMTIGFRKVTTGLHIMWRILWWMNERYLLYMVHNSLSPSRTMPCFPILKMLTELRPKVWPREYEDFDPFLGSSLLTMRACSKEVGTSSIHPTQN